jgi:ribosome recycling factor
LIFRRAFRRRLRVLARGPETGNAGRLGLVKTAALDRRRQLLVVRRDGVEMLRRREKDAEISQDQQRKLQQEVQHLTDDYIGRIDAALTQKDKEILQV